MNTEKGLHLNLMYRNIKMSKNDEQRRIFVMSVKIRIIVLIVVSAALLVSFFANKLKPNTEITNDVQNEKNIRWNKFINDVCYRDKTTLPEIQRKAVLCFLYDAEMNSGGYSGYTASYPDTDTEELAEAIRTVGYKEIADNYLKAVNEGENSDHAETDMAYYKFSPSLSDCLMEYVEENKDAITA